MRLFDLFSGIGGFREGLQRAGGFTCVGHCEADVYADRNYRMPFDKERTQTGGKPLVRAKMPGNLPE
ncbi:DNA cytosine methyltransferase [Blautia massiliensis (ex Durand et al. 2017)]|uniref:DNA cytosine methyltransferase n=1 Tax=Blautia massiliensis (ex Durand et al. 2017) TaxID=1737424 RepID=UPI003B511499